MTCFGSWPCFFFKLRAATSWPIQSSDSCVKCHLVSSRPTWGNQTLVAGSCWCKTLMTLMWNTYYIFDDKSIFYLLWQNPGGGLCSACSSVTNSPQVEFVLTAHKRRPAYHWWLWHQTPQVFYLQGHMIMFTVMLGQFFCKHNPWILTKLDVHLGCI